MRLAAGLLAVLAVTAPVAAATGESHGFYGLVEGAATVEQAGGVPHTAAADRPLLPGDRLETARGARVEVVLADDTLIRVADYGALVFATLAGSSDGDDGSNHLLLEHGELLITGGGATQTRVDTDNATVYLGAGAYRIERTPESTLLIVRRGEAELRSRQGTVVVSADEQAWVEGDGEPVVEAAGDADALERWAAALDARRERLASFRSWWRGFWLGFWEDDDSGAFFSTTIVDLDDGVCVDGVHVCRQGSGGGAARTRPPRNVGNPGEEVEDEPGSVVRPSDRERGGADDDAIEFAVAKPVLTVDSGEQTGSAAIAKPEVETSASGSWVVASVGDAIAGTNGPEAAPSKPTADEASWRDDDTPADDAPNSADDAVSSADDVVTSADVAVTSADVADSSTTVEPSSSDTPTFESAPASPEPASTSSDTSSDSSSAPSSDPAPAASDPAPAAYEPPAPPAADIEPNR